MFIKKYFSQNKTLLVLVLIFIFSIVTRFYQLGNWPEAFAADEAALGYSAWSILTTGRDEWGKLLPLTLRSIDDWKPAIYSYLAIPGIAMFGLNEMTSRLPAAIFGSLLPIFLYFLIARTTKNKNLGLLSALMIVISPWHLEVSRSAIEAGVALSIFILSLSLFAKKKESDHLWGLVLLLLTLFTYHTSRLLSPIIVLSAFWFNIFEAKRRVKLGVALIGILGIVLSLTASSSRFTQISIFNDFGMQLKREEAIREDGGVIHSPLLETRIFHNKPLSWTYSFADSYIKNTSLQFLFLGGAQPPRVTIPETGQFLLIMLPFLVLGLAASCYQVSNFYKWILFWLIISPIPVALTYAEIPHQYRTLFMLPPLAILMANGLQSSYLWLKKWNLLISKLFFIVISIITLYFFAKATHQYRVHQQVHQPWYRQAGYERLISYLNNINNVENITITNREGEPYIFVLFYNHILPIDYQNWPEKRLSHLAISAGSKQWKMFNYLFSEESCPFSEDDNNPNNIYVSMPNCDLPIGFEKLTTINFLDNNPEFLISHPASLDEKN